MDAKSQREWVWSQAHEGPTHEHPLHGGVELREVLPGVVVDRDGRYYPDPADLMTWSNPEGPRFGQVAVGDVLVLVLRAFLGAGGEPFSTNVMHFLLTKVSGSKTFAAAATGLAKYIFSQIGTDGSKLAGAYNPNVSFKGPIVRSLNTSTDEYQGPQSQAGTTGSATGSVPLRAAVVMHKGTAKAGRSFSGRSFFPAVDETHQRAGSLDAATVKRFQDFSDSLVKFQDPDDAATEYTFGVYSPKQTKATGSNVVTPVSSLAMRTIQGSQRNRQHIQT